MEKRWNSIPMIKLRYILIPIFFLFANFVFSQEKKPLLQIRFPADGDTVSYSKIRIAGCTRPGATVTINDDSIRVYQSGAFVYRVNLNLRENEIIITASDSIEEKQSILHIYRQPPIPVSPTRPAEIDSRIMWPAQDIVLISGDIIEVRFKGSPGGKAKFSIDKLCKNIMMTELKPGEASGMQGIYAGTYRLKSKKLIKAKPVKFELKGVDGRKRKAESMGRITVYPDAIPLIGETNKDTYMKTSPYGFGVMSILSAGVRLLLHGQRGNHYKIQLTENEYAYVACSDVDVLPTGTPIPKTSISLPSISFDKDWIKLNMSVHTACPYQIRQTVKPAMLELTVYGAHLLSQWTTYPGMDTTIKMIRWAQPSADVFKLYVDLNQSQQWGHRIRFESGRMVLEIRCAPKIAEPPQSPLAGLIFTLDAGHGGNEFGAVGPTGLMEKDVNLIYTHKLAALLDSAGAKVILTRQTDTTMTLADRIEIARQANTHIFCWLHNNSIGATSDPEAIRGTSTYFTIPQNQALAWTIYPHLLKIGLTPFGRVQSDYFVTRQTDMLNVLVEGAFMSHPEDEMLLTDVVFLDKLARAVFDGLEEFCKKQISK